MICGSGLWRIHAIYDFFRRRVYCEVFIVREFGQFLQPDACVFESGDDGSPYEQAIGKSLEEIVFSVHGAPPKRCMARIFKSRI